MTDQIEQVASRPPGRPRVTSLEDRRAHLLEAAEQVFLTSGYHAATMNDVARGAGMSKRTVYQVFVSKSALFEALLTDRFKPLTMPLEADDRPMADRLSDVLLRLVRFTLAPRQIALVRLMIAEAPQSHEMADALSSLGIGRGKGVLERWLAREVEQGRLRVAHPEEAALTLFFAAIGDAWLLMLLQTADPPGDALIAARVAYAVRMFLREAAVEGAA